MKKEKIGKGLSLRKERIVALNKTELANVNGGEGLSLISCTSNARSCADKCCITPCSPRCWTVCPD